MWFRRSALRPVPASARIDSRRVDAIRARLDDHEALVDAAARFEAAQPALVAWTLRALSRVHGDRESELGRTLCLAVWLAFDAQFGARLGVLDDDDVSAADTMLLTDTELRLADPSASLDTDEVLALEQPALVELLNQLVAGGLDVDAEALDVDSVDVAYRAALVVTLALSHAVDTRSGTVRWPT